MISVSAEPRPLAKGSDPGLAKGVHFLLSSQQKVHTKGSC